MAIARLYHLQKCIPPMTSLRPTFTLCHENNIDSEIKEYMEHSPVISIAGTQRNQLSLSTFFLQYFTLHIQYLEEYCRIKTLSNTSRLVLHFHWAEKVKWP